jgi:TolB-like protein
MSARVHFSIFPFAGGHGMVRRSALLALMALFGWSLVAAAPEGAATFHMASGKVKAGKLVEVLADSLKIQPDGGSPAMTLAKAKFSKVVLADGKELDLSAKPAADSDWSDEAAAPAPVPAVTAVPVAPLSATGVKGGGAAPNKAKLNVAVLDFDGAEGQFTQEELATLTTRFETELMKTDSFQVLERRNISNILQEQGFQASGACNTSECQVEMGQMLGVERIINGSVGKAGKIISINLKMVDVGSGANLMSHALDIKGDMGTVMRGGCFEMAQIFSGRKKPGNSRTVLAAEKPLWPWIVGGSAVVAGGAAAVILLTQESEPKPYTVEMGL